MIGRSRSLLLVLAGMVSFPVEVRAQDARVVIANYPNGRILDIRFDPPGHTVLNTDAGSRVGLVSLAFRDDGAAGVHLFAADRQRGQVVFYTNSVGQGAIVLDRATATNPPYPAGLSLDAHHNLYGTTSEIGMGADKDARVWVIRRDPACTGGCLPGGYAPTVGTIDGTVEITVPISGVPTLLTVELLAESRVVPFNAGTLTAGDLLVLASDPPALLRYPAPAVQAFLDQLAQGGTPAEIEPEVFIFPSTADVSPERRFPAGAEPNGMDFTSQGNLLVSAGNGTILIYRPDGTRLSDSSVPMIRDTFGAPKTCTPGGDGVENLLLVGKLAGFHTFDGFASQLVGPRAGFARGFIGAVKIEQELLLSGFTKTGLIEVYGFLGLMIEEIYLRTRDAKIMTVLEEIVSGFWIAQAFRMFPEPDADMTLFRVRDELFDVRVAPPAPETFEDVVFEAKFGGETSEFLHSVERTVAAVVEIFPDGATRLDPVGF
jgi:hypothetical protein